MTEAADLLVPPRVGLGTIALEWGRIGCIGFGGPPTHIVLLRQLCVQRRRWISETEFEDGIAATNLLPGPASTQLAIFTAWRLRGLSGALVGGVCFIVPGLVLILALAALFLAGPPVRPRALPGRRGRPSPLRHPYHQRRDGSRSHLHPYLSRRETHRHDGYSR